MYDFFKFQPIGLSLFHGFNESFITKDHEISPNLPVNLRSMYDECFVNKSDQELSDICDAKFTEINVTEEQAVHIELMTRQQSCSPPWHQMRMGRITASRAHAVMHTDLQNPALSIIKGITTKLNPFTSPYTQYGLDKEPIALCDYGCIFADMKGMSTDLTVMLQGWSPVKHNAPSVRKSGLYISTDIPFLAASPDGVFSCGCHPPILLEVKCLWRLQYETLQQYVNGSDSCLNKDFSLKKHHQYYTQVQLQLFVTQYDECHFIMWTPSDMFVCAVKRDKVFIDDMLEKLQYFYKQVIFPEILTRKENGHEAKRRVHITDDSLQRCPCGKGNTVNMVCCDKCDQWFHFHCVGRKRF